MSNINLFSLSILIFAPLVFAGIIAMPWFSDDRIIIRRTSQWFGWGLFIYSLILFTQFNPSQGMQMVESIKWNTTQSPWIYQLGINYTVGVDGISMALVVLTTFITLLALHASKDSITKRHKLYYSMLFILTSAILGVFCAQDLFLFFTFWEIELIPMYFLIAIWGTGRAQYSATKFILYTLTGSIFLLTGILLIYYINYLNTGVLTFDMETLSQSSIPFGIQVLAFAGFFIGFAVKLPVVPFHTWLPDAHVDAPTPISMILAGILLKMGGYGLIRFNVGLLPDALKVWAPYLALFAVINIVYGAFIALKQQDMKKLVAYSSVSHMGIVLLGIAAMNSPGINGAVFQMISHGLVSAGLFMLVGTVYLRTHTRDLEQLGGLSKQIPVISGFFIVIALAGLGLPLLVGFASETMVFYGAFISNSFNEIQLFSYTFPFSIQIFTIIAISGIIVTAAYILRLIEKVFYGPMFERWRNIKDTAFSYAKYQEILVLTLLLIPIVIFGCLPQLLLNIFESSVSNMTVIKKPSIISYLPISENIGDK